MARSHSIYVVGYLREPEGMFTVRHEAESAIRSCFEEGDLPLVVVQRWNDGDCRTGCACLSGADFLAGNRFPKINDPIANEG